MNTVQEKFEDWFIYTNRPSDDSWKQLDHSGDYLNPIIQQQFDIWADAWIACLNYNFPINKV